MIDDKRTQQVNLGCGTLILIALIVIIFGGRGTGEVEGLKSEIGELRKAVDAQTVAIKQLQQKLDKQQSPAGAPKK
jgi:hypothetical protein